MKLLLTLIWIAGIGGFCFYFIRFGLSHLYDYAVGREGVEFWIFRTLNLFTIRFERIEDVIEQPIFVLVDSRPSSIFLGLVIGNRLSTRFIVLKMKSGFVRYIAITPANRTEFLDQVRRCLSKYRSHGMG